jgi:hypothetical protein
MKKILLVHLFLTVVATKAFNQNNTDEEQIKACINNLFTAMKTIDTTLLKSCFANDAILQTIISNPKGNNVKTDALNSFVNSIAKQTANTLDEQISFEKVLTDGILASVYTPYNFYFKGNFSHCGINSFQLVKLNGEWKIVYLIDTRYKNKCKP